MGACNTNILDKQNFVVFIMHNCEGYQIAQKCCKHSFPHNTTADKRNQKPQGVLLYTVYARVLVPICWL